MFARLFSSRVVKAVRQVRGHWIGLVACALGAILSTAGSLHATVIYDSIPSPLPGNVPSLGFQATSTAEFGDYIKFGSGPRLLTNVRVTMSDWAKQSENPTYTDPNGYQHPLTLNIYNVDNSGPTPKAGSLIATTTVNALIPWRPEVFGFGGIAFNVDFPFPAVLVPEEIIFGVAYNTQSYGTSPLGAPGPYNSLNVGLRDTGVFGPVTTGTDVNTNAVFWNTSFAGFYTDKGAGGVGVFRQDTDWSPYAPAALFEAVPEPTSMVVFGMFTAGMLAYGRRRRTTPAIK